MTIKLLNFDLIYKGVPRFCGTNLSKFKMSNMSSYSILGDPGADKGARESLNGRKNMYGMKKSKERREEPLGTMSYQTSSKRSPPFWLLIGARKTQVFKFPFFTFLRAIFFRPFRLSLVPTICPWVSEDVHIRDIGRNFFQLSTSLEYFYQKRYRN